MIRKTVLILFVSSCLVTPGCARRPKSELALASRSASPVLAEEAIRCLPESDVSNALQRLSFGKSESEAGQAQELLINETKRSPACRDQVVAVIMSAMDKPNVDFTRDPAMYQVWYNGAKMLGDLKADKALDLLISHLDLSTGLFSTTMSQQPALWGVIKMGPLAIPKLSELLKHNSDRDMRRYAVYCIAGIGGPVAKRALEQALPSESDPCVNRFIRISIDTIDVKSGGLKHDTVKWFTAFQCE